MSFINQSSLHTKPSLGLIGLGDMGSRMARNLIQAGYTVYGFDTNPERLQQCVADGLKAQANNVEVVQASDVVLTSLPSSDAFVQVAEETLLPQARPGQIFVDLGTTTPPETRRLAGAFQEREAILLDVPVSGWITGAERGTLRMWGGGDETTFERCRPIFEIMGDPELIFYCGPSGSGQILKGVNQLLMGVVTGAYLEIIAFAVQSGVDIPTLCRTMPGTGRKEELRNLALRIEAGDGAQIGAKFRELPYFLIEAREQGFTMPLTQALYEFCDKGERVVTDDNRPAPSLWHELTHPESPPPETD